MGSLRGIFLGGIFFLSEEAVAYLCQRDYTSTVHVCLFFFNNISFKQFTFERFFNGNKNSWLIFRKFFFWMQKVFFKNHSWPYDFYL